MSKADESAQRGAAIILQFSDNNAKAAAGRKGEPLFALELDVADVVADLHHLSDQFGLDWRRVLERAEQGHAGDVDEGGGAATPSPVDAFGQ